MIREITTYLYNEIYQKSVDLDDKHLVSMATSIRDSRVKVKIWRARKNDEIWYVAKFYAWSGYLPNKDMASDNLEKLRSDVSRVMELSNHPLRWIE